MLQDASGAASYLNQFSLQPTKSPPLYPSFPLPNLNPHSELHEPNFHLPNGPLQPSCLSLKLHLHIRTKNKYYQITPKLEYKVLCLYNMILKTKFVMPYNYHVYPHLFIIGFLF